MGVMEIASLADPREELFSYAWFSLNAAKAGPQHAACDASAAPCWKGSMEEDGKSCVDPD